MSTITLCSDVRSLAACALLMIACGNNSSDKPNDPQQPSAGNGSNGTAGSSANGGSAGSGGNAGTANAGTANAGAPSAGGHTHQDSTKRLVGFLVQDGKVPPDYDLSRLTHLVYFALIPQENGGLWGGSSEESFVPNMLAMRDRVHQAGSKIIISVGGIPSLSKNFIALAQNPEARRTFVTNIVEFARSNQMDGIDIDWEKWPDDGVIDQKQSQSFVDLMRELYPETRKHNLSLSADVAASDWYGRHYHQDLFQYADWFNIMAFAFSGEWSAQISHHSGLDETIKSASYWSGRGMPNDKILLGVPFFGTSFKGAKPWDPVNGPSALGWTPTFRRISERLAAGQYTEIKHEPNVGAYVVSENEVTFFNDAEDLRAKAKLVHDNDYGGIMIWELLQDAPGDKTLIAPLHEALHPSAP